MYCSIYSACFKRKRTLKTFERFGGFPWEWEWVGNELTVVKIAFFPFFDPTWTHILAPKGPYMGLLYKNFNIQSLRKTEAILLPSMRLKLTK